MNSQCNGSFLPKWQETRAGNSRLVKDSLFRLSVFLGERPNGPKTPTLAHVWRTASRWSGFTAQGPIATCAKSACFVRNLRF